MPTKYEKILTTPFQIKLNNGKIYREKETYNKYSIILQEKKISKNLEGKKEPLLSIARAFSTEYGNQYIYMDLNPSCMLYIRQNRPELSKYLPFSKTKYEDLMWQFNFQKKAYENCRGLFTMSQWVKDIIVESTGISPDKVHVVGGGINLDVSYIKNEKKNNNKILFVGKDFYRKGGDLVVKAFQRLKKEMPEAELYVVGPSEKPKEIDFAPEGIHFLGFLSYKEVAKYFNKCDIFCMPSRFEAFGLVYIEALVYGLPCIVNNDFAMKEIVHDGENGYLLYDQDVEIFKDKMKMLLKNDKIKENVLKNRNKYLKDYAWDTVAEKMLSIIKADE